VERHVPPRRGEPNGAARTTAMIFRSLMVITSRCSFKLHIGKKGIFLNFNEAFLESQDYFSPKLWKKRINSYLKNEEIA